MQVVGYVEEVIGRLVKADFIVNETAIKIIET